MQTLRHNLSFDKTEAKESAENHYFSHFERGCRLISVDAQELNTKYK